uniref:Integrase catalytic domain-containing protein n=1 Tax=Amphilophus citrinellus TaxID=61819 RepID=A0A3Q0SX77_AMPCI
RWGFPDRIASDNGKEFVDKTGFANETIKGFELLSNTQKSHRWTLLKHDMTLDYILAEQGGLCMTLNLTGDACYTLIPDSSDNITSVIDQDKLQMQKWEIGNFTSI